MLKYLIFFFALFGVQSASYAIGSDTIGEASSCVLEVKGKRFINGPCPVVFGGDGGLTVGSNGTKSLPFWAMVLPDGDNRASGEGFWNESPGSSHAHSRLGDLTRSGDCWENSSTRICVIGFKPADSTSTQNNIHQSQSSVIPISAKRSPVKCEVKYEALNAIWCDVFEDGLSLEDISVNRGNCRSPKERILSLLKFNGQDPQTSPYYPFDKKYNFGNRFWIDIGGCRPLEYSLKLNGNWWTWSTY